MIEARHVETVAHLLDLELAPGAPNALRLSSSWRSTPRFFFNSVIGDGQPVARLRQSPANLAMRSKRDRPRDAAESDSWPTPSEESNSVNS